MLASLVSRMISRPLYESLAEHMLTMAIGPLVPPDPDDPLAAGESPREP